MKKQLFTFLAIAPVAVFAQQLEAGDIIPSVGDSTSYYVMKDPNTISAPSAPGNNATWDFSTMKFDDSTTLKFEAPITTGRTQDPANTTIAEQFSGRLGDRIQYKATTKYLHIMGTKAGIRQTSYGKDSLLKFQFPAKYNDSHTTIINSESGGRVKTYRIGSYKTTIDGYGKLVLPYGDLKGVFRVKVEMNYRDSINVVGRPVITGRLSATTYEYWQKGSVSYVMRVSYDDDGRNKDTVVIYRKPAEVIFNPTGLATLNVNGSLKLYPNPASDFITVELNDLAPNTSFRIFNILGETKMEGTLENAKRIDVKDLNTGLYFIEIVGVNTAPVRFIKK